MIFDSAGLDEFARERSPSPTGSVALPGWVSLEDLIARSLPIQWDEAVAVIEQACVVLSPPTGRELAVPDLGDILISADGAVTIRGSGRGDTGPTGLGRVLHALLETADVPVALRLFVTQSTAPETYQTIREFATALAYYGKPGRAELVQGVYQRYVEMTGTAVQTAQKAVPPPVPVHPRDSDARATLGLARKTRKRRLPRWLIPCAALAGLVGAAAWVWLHRPMSGASAGVVATVLSDAKEAIKRFDPRTADAAAPAAGTVNASAKPAAEKTSSAAGPVRPKVESAVEAKLVAPAQPVVIPAPSFEPAQPPLVAVAPPPVTETPTPAEPGVSSITTGPPRNDVAQVVYSRQDADVQPPVLRYPQLPPPLMVDISRVGAVNRMELVVARDGTVERVRLIDGPTRMPDMMLLSGAKMWKFEPALKDGEPVRYRTILSWAGFP